MQIYSDGSCNVEVLHRPYFYCVYITVDIVHKSSGVGWNWFLLH